MQEDFGHQGIFFPRGIQGLFPARGTKTPFATLFQTGDLAEVVAAGGGEVEEFLCEEGGDGVVLLVCNWLVWVWVKGGMGGFWGGGGGRGGIYYLFRNSKIGGFEGGTGGQGIEGLGFSWRGRGEKGRGNIHRHLQAQYDSSRRGRSPSWAFGRRGPGVCGRLLCYVKKLV